MHQMSNFAISQEKCDFVFSSCNLSYNILIRILLVSVLIIKCMGDEVHTF